MVTHDFGGGRSPERTGLGPKFPANRELTGKTAVFGRMKRYIADIEANGDAPAGTEREQRSQ